MAGLIFTVSILSGFLWLIIALEKESNSAAVVCLVSFSIAVGATFYGVTHPHQYVEGRVKCVVNGHVAINDQVLELSEGEHPVIGSQVKLRTGDSGWVVMPAEPKVKLDTDSWKHYVRGYVATPITFPLACLAVLCAGWLGYRLGRAT